MEQQPHAVIPAISLLIFLLNALSMITKGAQCTLAGCTKPRENFLLKRNAGTDRQIKKKDIQGQMICALFPTFTQPNFTTSRHIPLATRTGRWSRMESAPKAARGLRAFAAAFAQVHRQKHRRKAVVANASKNFLTQVFGKLPKLR
jgi:hypothetical protein